MSRAKVRDLVDNVLNEINSKFTSSTLNQSLLKRIIGAEHNLTLHEQLNITQLAEKALDAHAKYIEFFANISFDPLYTISDDRNAQEQVDSVRKLVDNRTQNNRLVEETLNFADIRSANLGEAIHSNPAILDVIRYFAGLGDITFELLASGWLHKEGHYAGVVKFHSIEQIKRFVRDNIDAATCIANNVIERFKLRSVLSILQNLTNQQRAELVDLLARYQVIGRLSKLSGHKAEMIIAQHLHSKRIPFEPQHKLSTLGSPDIEVPRLGTSRLFDLVIPNATDPKVIIECAYYNSNTGSVASKVVRECALTVQRIRSNADEDTRNIRLIGFVDGAGWIAMSGHLIKMLLILDDFIQLNTLDKLRNYL